jgi:hypothetical protein
MEAKTVYLPRTHPINTTAPSVNLWRRGKSYFSSTRQAGLLDRRAVSARNRSPFILLNVRIARDPPGVPGSQAGKVGKRWATRQDLSIRAPNSGLT